MSSDEKWMRVAIEQAEHAYALHEVPVGAVVVRDDSIIGSGYNQPIKANDPSAHAEIVALRDASSNEANYRLPGATLYVTVEPCTMCFGAIVHARIARVVFGAVEPRAGVIQSKLGLAEQPFYNHSVEYKGGVLEEECSGLMRRFFAERR